MTPSSGEISQRAGIALGSNLGDRMAHLEEAIRRMRGLGAPGDFLVSRCRETAPVDCAPGMAPFLNAVLEMGWTGPARSLLNALLAIEIAMGRPARHPHHAPRTIDLDLLYLGSVTVREPDLILPHPRIAERGFVLHPLADIRPGLILPDQCETVRDLAGKLPDPPPPVIPWRGNP